MTLKVGQKILFVPSGYGRRDPEMVAVAKVGRVYAEVKPENGREFKVHMETMRAQSQYRSGVCHVDPEAYYANKRKRRKWDQISRIFRDRHVPPAEMSEEDLDKILSILVKEPAPDGPEENPDTPSPAI